MKGEIVSSSARDDEAFIGSEKAGSLETPAQALIPLELTVGQQLRAAREAKGLSAGEIAKALKLSPSQVEALEADDWARLPCNTIIRGFVRNYARLLKLDPDALMTSLDRMNLPNLTELEMPIGTNVSVPNESRVERHDYIRVISGLIVLALAVLAYFFFPMGMWQSAVNALKAATQSDQTGSVSVVPQTQSDAKDKATEAVVTPPGMTLLPAQPDSPPSALPAAPAPTPQSSSENVLKFSFSQPSWVEVRDRKGEIIFSQLSEAGSQREIEGQPPFTLVIGNAGQVTLQYKGKQVDLSRRSKDDVARVSVE